MSISNQPDDLSTHGASPTFTHIGTKHPMQSMQPFSRQSTETTASLTVIVSSKASPTSTVHPSRSGYVNKIHKYLVSS